jgi:hypothetical protein
MENATVALGQIWLAQHELVARWQNRGRGLRGGWLVAPTESSEPKAGTGEGGGEDCLGVVGNRFGGSGQSGSHQ